jgi:hypothetical protein
MGYQCTINVANPSAYPRSDYVEVALDALGVPDSAVELRLFRLRGPERTEVFCQLDHPFGDRARTLTFFAEDLPPAADDYTEPSACFSLEEGGASVVRPDAAALKIEYFHEEPDGTRILTPDGAWDRTRALHGVKLHNGFLKVYFSLAALSEMNYTGSATSVFHRGAAELMDAGIHRGDDEAAGRGSMLKPYGGSGAAQTRWGQLSHLVFYPLPWEPRWYHTASLLEDAGRPRRYELVWSNEGPLRAVVTLRSEPLAIEYTGAPYFSPERVTVTCRLYRVIFLYPYRHRSPLDSHSDFYTEHLVVRTEDGRSLAFRPHFYSSVEYPGGVFQELNRFEHVPDYFAVWRSSGPFWRGYGFASDAHVRAPVLTHSDLRWHLQVSHSPRCIHIFMCHGFPSEVDRLKVVGHSWYERLYKPLQVIPLKPALARHDRHA